MVCLAARGATCVAFGLLNVGMVLWSSVRASLHHFFFIEHRVEVHEACGSQVSVSWVGLSRPQEAAASGPRRLGATRKKRKRRNQERHALNGKHVALSRVLLERPTASRPHQRRRLGTDVGAPLRVLPRKGPGVLIPTSKLAWNVSSREAGSWQGRGARGRFFDF